MNTDTTTGAKTVVILGGSGFVGRCLSATLAGLGHSVYSISRSPVIAGDPQVNYIDCNFDNTYQLGELYQRADVIFHLACDTTPATSSRQSSLEVTTNLLPSLRLIEYLEHKCSSHLVYVSTGGAIYGDMNGAPVSELSPMSPISYYGAGKAAIELFLHAYHRQTRNGVSIIRPANLYGPGQIAKQQFGIVPTLLNALAQDKPFQMMGDGENLRDFVYIDDFSQMCVALLNSTHSSGHLCETYNVGSGQGVSLNQLVALAETVAGKGARLQRLPARGVDVRAIVVDSSKAQADFGWQCAVSLERGMRQTWQWMTAG